MRRLGLLLPIAALLGIVVAAVLVVASPAGTRLVIDWASARFQGALSVENLEGSAWSGLSAERVRWTGPALSIEVDDPQIRFDWSRLLRGALVVEQLRLGSLRVVRLAASSPVALPASLGVPRRIFRWKAGYSSRPGDCRCRSVRASGYCSRVLPI